MVIEVIIMAKVIRIHDKDNVAVVLSPVKAGEAAAAGNITVTALEDIPQGHKIALCDIKKGDQIIKYGFSIGHAEEDIGAGNHVHTHNMKTNLEGEIDYTYDPAGAKLPSQEPAEFMGFLRKDGRAAIRNEVWIIPTVGCVNGVVKTLAEQNRDLVSGSVDGIYAFTHPFGCSQTGHDHAQTRKLLAALCNHPNAASVLVVSLGCENLTHEQFLEELGDFDPDRVKFMTCQEVPDEFETGWELLKECVYYAKQFERQPLPANMLV